MLRFITQKLRNQSLNEVKPIDTQVAQAWVCSEMENESEEGPSTVDQLQSVDETSVSLGIFTVAEEDNSNNFTENTLRGETDTLLESMLQNKENYNFNLCTACQQVRNTTEDMPTRQNLNLIIGDCPDCVRHRGVSNPLKRPNSRYSRCATQGEKRKLSSNYERLKLPPLSSIANDSSSDDEIKDLCSRGSKSAGSSPPEKMSALSSSPVFRAKRQEIGVICIGNRRGAASASPRPSLNFEKMQQKLLKRQRPRIVKIKAIQPTNREDFSQRTSMVAFKPINLLPYPSSRLVPVEEPMQSGFAF